VAHAQALFPSGTLTPQLQPLPGDGPVQAEAAVLACVRGRMEVAGPVTATGLALALALPPEDVSVALHALEAEGTLLRGHFRPSQPVDAELEWCDRTLLQRIHRLTVGRLRREIEPLSASDFMRFLFRWHRLLPGEALQGDVGLLLEQACWRGEVAWGRLCLREAKAVGPRRGAEVEVPLRRAPSLSR